MQRRSANTKKHTEKEIKKPAKKHVLDVKIRKHISKKARHAGVGHPVVLNEGAPNREVDRVNYRRQTEKYKSLIMWSGVSFFMILIVFVWTLNIKKILNAGIADNINANELNGELTQNLEQLKNNLEEFKDIKGKVDTLKDYSGSVTSTIPLATEQEPSSPTGAEKSSTSSPQNAGVAEEGSILIDKLEQLEQKLESKQ